MKDQKSGCRILLITPPQGLWRQAVEKPWNSTQPLGLAYIGASLRAAGYPVEIMDAYSLGLSPMAIRERIKSFSPAIVGISALTPQWPDAETLAGIVKDIDQEILTVVGGPHVTALPAEAARRPGVDMAVVGEGEDIMVALCDAVVSGGDLLGVPGLFLGREGDIQSTGSVPAITDLDRLPFPAHDLLPEPSFYNPFPSWGKKGHFSCIISGRGCPYQCTFCDVTAQQGKRYRLRSAENIVDEISWLNREFGVTTLSFRDPSMVCNRKRLLEICRLIGERRLDIAWTCNSRANEVDPEMLAAMRRAGCRRMQYGIEVGNPEMLKAIKKTTKEQVAQAVSNTRRAGIMAHGYFLFGFIDETRETIEETIAFATELDLDSASFAVMVPFPGTSEYERYDREGLLLTRDWREYNIMGRPTYSHRNVSSDELMQAPRRAYRRFYLRPRVIVRQLRRMTSFWAFREYAHVARRVFR
ncbi:MAG: B12-binding domain-containing radical SAM protein [Thermoleophilia bacterium]